MIEETPEMLESEMVAILTDIARNASSSVARIQAIKLLRVMRDESPPAPTGSFAELYEVGVNGSARRRHLKTKD